MFFDIRNVSLTIDGKSIVKDISINVCSSLFNELHEVTIDIIKNRLIFFIKLILLI